MTCRVDGCSNNSCSKGLCKKHYERMRRRGNLEYTPYTSHSEGRICTQCNVFKPASFFSFRRDGKSTARLGSRCLICRKENYHQNPERARDRAREYYWNNRDEVRRKSREARIGNVAVNLWKDAKYRASRKGIPFDIAISDVIVPEKCPVLGIPLVVSESKSSANSPTLDRIVPALGYVKGNVMVMSHRANTIKNDATPEELMRVAEFYSAATVRKLAG